MSRPRLVAALALVVALPVGCGPVEYLAQVGGRASASLAQARREKADELAPYEYTALAAEYLKKAREEAGRFAVPNGSRVRPLGRGARRSRESPLAGSGKAGRSWEEPGSGGALAARWIVFGVAIIAADPGFRGSGSGRLGSGR
ncbi:MAG: hypothetical protein KA712_22985 [Myxococcales bacterium]|nr:hypothetical protein [Myxococcales bacterium]